MGVRYTTPREGEWVRPVMRGYRMKCCDCGLVHWFQFRVIRWGRGHKILFRAYRLERATAASRRWNGYGEKSHGVAKRTISPHDAKSVRVGQGRKV